MPPSKSPATCGLSPRRSARRCCRAMSSCKYVACAAIIPATTSRKQRCRSSSSREALGVSTLNTPMTLRACSRPGSQLICGASTGTLRKASEDSSSSVRIKNLLRKTGCPLRHSTMTGLPVTKTWPVTPMPGSYTTWALRGAPSATHRRNVRVSGSKMTRCGRRNPCRSVRSESKELSEDWNPRCGPIPAAMRCRVSMYGTGFIKTADDCSDIRIKKGTGREARFKSLVRYRVHQCEEKNGTVGPPHP